MELLDITSSFSLENSSSSSDIIHVVSNVSAPLFDTHQLDAGSEIPKPVSLWPGMYHSPVTKVLWETRSNVLKNSPNEAIHQCGLTTKSPSSSRTSIMYKFSTDVILREQYRNPWNEIRMGKVIEDLDALAGVVSFKHCSNEDRTRPFSLVTASVDKLVLKKPIYVDCDLTISGAVTWVGRSSVEVQLEITPSSVQENQDPLDSVSLVANFTFVARDSLTGKAVPINPISPETKQEKLLWQEAQERNEMRKNKRTKNKLDLKIAEPPRLDTFSPEQRFSSNKREICLENSMICQPQHRNTQGQIFGGFLMRRAYELAFANAYSFIGAKPIFMEIDHVEFLRPVDVGDLLRYRSRIIFPQLDVEDSSKHLINVEVVAHVTRPELQCSEISNRFYFTFGVRSRSTKTETGRTIVRQNEEDMTQNFNF